MSTDNTRLEFKIIVINPGSTSTKIALFTNKHCEFKETLTHTREELAPFSDIIDQYEFRKNAIMEVLKKKRVKLDQLSAAVGRGGLIHPVESGTYTVNEQMIKDLTKGVLGKHESNLGGLIANELARSLDIPAYIVDPVVVDELHDVARISGVPELPRVSTFHALSQKAVARKAAEELGKPYEELNLVVAHLGGGISVGAHYHGKVIDVDHAIDETSFSPERVGYLPVRDLIEMCYSGSYTQKEILKKIQKEAGLAAYFGTTDCIKIEKRINEGDSHAKLIYEAMVYQVCKEIGAYATVLKGKVDAIVITGAMSRSKMIEDWIRLRVSYIAPILTFPGEFEMEALAEGAYTVLAGITHAKEYKVDNRGDSG
jgi:butyrate kinase